MSSNQQSDFNFKNDKINNFIPLIIGFLMYSATITIMSGVFTNNLTSDWNDSLKGKITIEFQSNFLGAEGGLSEKQNKEIIKTVSNTPGIKTIRLLRENDILKIIEPWLNGTSIPDDFPFPTIFDVITEKDANIDLLSLTNKLSKISEGVKIYNHATWYDPILKIGKSLFLFSMLLSILIFITVSVTVIFITKQTLKTHEKIAKILQLIGASDNYIASQFKRYFLSIGFKCALLSYLLSGITILSLYFALNLEINTEFMQYIFITIITPLISVVLIMYSAKKSVLFFLKNDKWILK